MALSSVQCPRPTAARASPTRAFLLVCPAPALYLLLLGPLVPYQRGGCGVLRMVWSQPCVPSLDRLQYASAGVVPVTHVPILKLGHAPRMCVSMCAYFALALWVSTLSPPGRGALALGKHTWATCAGKASKRKKTISVHIKHGFAPF